MPTVKEQVGPGKERPVVVADVINLILFLVKKKFIVFGLLAGSVYGFGQTDSVYRKTKVSKTDIQIVYSHYLQDGTHSAVTGGTGTEELKVYSPGVNVQLRPDSLNSFFFEGGLDIISSASTDNIDFVVSSASRVDRRGYLNTTYNRNLKSGLTLGGSVYFSLESDYTSLGFGASARHQSKDKGREFSISFEAFFDDLRWGRLTEGFFNPQKLIYPQELRYKEWFNQQQRNSYNLNLELIQTINRRMTLGIFVSPSFQEGLLSTPFHRVYFNDDTTVRVENLPEHRIKLPVGLQLNSFIGNRYIVRAFYRFYWDDWGIIAHTLSAEIPIKITPALTVAPSIRYYTQSEAFYFKPYKQHSTNEEFYTSDYDLSRFESYQPAMEVRFVPLSRIGKRSSFNEVILRYAYYTRNDGLQAHFITTLLEFSFASKKKIGRLAKF